MITAARLLRDHGLTVETIAHRVGYTSVFAFSNAFKRNVGHPPRHYRHCHVPSRISPPMVVANLADGTRPLAAGTARMRSGVCDYTLDCEEPLCLLQPSLRRAALHQAHLSGRRPCLLVDLTVTPSVRLSQKALHDDMVAVWESANDAGGGTRPRRLSRMRHRGDVSRAWM